VPKRWLAKCPKELRDGNRVADRLARLEKPDAVRVGFRSDPRAHGPTEALVHVAGRKARKLPELLG
jgi:hypothetical protein